MTPMGKSHLTVDDKKFLERVLLRTFQDEYEFILRRHARLQDSDFFTMECCIRALKGLGDSITAEGLADKVVEIRRAYK